VTPNARSAESFHDVEPPEPTFVSPVAVTFESPNTKVPSHDSLSSATPASRPSSNVLRQVLQKELKQVLKTEAYGRVTATEQELTTEKPTIGTHISRRYRQAGL
jgi:hypothetical protein